MRPGILRGEKEGLAKMNDRSIKLALPGQSIAQIVMGLGVVRMDAQGFMKLLHGFS